MLEKIQFLFAQTKGLNEDGSLDAVASTGAVDRDNEIIEPSAWLGSLDRFRTNPVILAGHQHRLSGGSSPVIGSAPEIRIEGGELVFRMRFAGTTLGQEYKQLYSEKHMRAFSVGFLPKKADWRDDKAKGRKILVHTEVELLEISAVPVPANPEALARARAAAFAAAAFGDDPEKAIGALAEKVAGAVGLGLAEKRLSEQIENLKTQLDTLKTALVDGLEDLKAFLPDTVNPPDSESRTPDPERDGEDAGKKSGAVDARDEARKLRAELENE